MGRDATKAAGNPWYQARKKAAEYDDRLCSRESAAEQLGMSVSSLADAELGNTKFMPVDKAVLMADRYNAPWLLNHYCLNECPIGCRHSLSDEVVGIDRVTVKLLKSLKTEQLGEVKDTLLDIAADGKITEDEKPALQEVLTYLDDLAKTVSELKTIGEMALNEDGDAHGSKYLHEEIPLDFDLQCHLITSEVKAKAGVVNCCDTAKWYGKDMTPEEKAELKKGQREWEKSRFRKWICQEALSAINESDVKKIKETGRQEGGKMNNHWCKVSAMVCITAEDVDLILYEALNAGGISAWSDAVKTVGDKLGKRVCEQVALGGELMIHEIGGEWHKLSWQNLMSGVEQYLNESCHIRIEDERLALDDLTTNEADVIVQFALFGETKF